MELLRECNIFGHEVSFNMMGKSKSKSLVGSVFTIILVMLTVLCIISFGKDFFDKINPTLLFTNIVPETYGPMYQLTSSNVQFPFRVMNYFSRETLDYSGLMEPIATLNQFRAVNGTLTLVEKLFIDTIPCTEELIPPELLKLVSKPSDYLCYDFEKANYTLGGGLDADFYSFLQLKYRCTKNKITSLTTPEECDYDALNNKINEGQQTAQYAYIEILYPEYYITQDLVEPLKLTYNSYKYELTLTSQNSEFFDIQKVKFYDDQGWITNQISEYERITTEKYETSQTVMTKDMVTQDGWSIFIFDLELDKNYNKYERHFMKISNLAAQVGGIINAIYTGMIIIYLLFFKYIQKEALMNSAFLYLGKSEEKNQSPDFVLKSSKIGVSSFVRLNNVMNSQNAMNSQIKLSQINANVKRKSIQPKKLENFASNKFENPKYGFFFGLKTLVCPQRRMNDLQTRIYLKMDKLLTRKMDICYYFDILRQFSTLKSLLLNPIQKKCLSYLKRINIYNKEEVDDFGIISEENNYSVDVDQIINYFNGKLQDNQINEIDKKILNSLRNDIKCKII